MKKLRQSENACYQLVQHLWSSSWLSKNVKIKIHRSIILPVGLYDSETYCHMEVGTQAEGVQE